MMNIFTDKYFTITKQVASNMGMNPIVSYRIFIRCDGMAALKPFKILLNELIDDENVIIKTLPEGFFFRSGDTVATIEGPFQSLVEFESMWLWYVALPCYCALEAKKIVEEAGGRSLLAFENRHNFGAEATALTSYGASVGGIDKSSCDVGANALKYIKRCAMEYKDMIKHGPVGVKPWPNQGIGTTPHALFAIFKGNYKEACHALLCSFPDQKEFMILNDYNNREIDDSLVALEVLGENLFAVRSDTCGENSPQMCQGKAADPQGIKGVHPGGLIALRKALNANNGEKVKICGTSGFDFAKTKTFVNFAPEAIDIIGTGSFIPKWPTATADIFKVDGNLETKAGREWGYEANLKFNSILANF